MSHIEEIINSISFLSTQGIINPPPITSFVGTIMEINTGSTGDIYAVVLPTDTNLNEVGYVQLSPSDTSLNFLPSVGARVTVNLFDAESGYIAQYGAVSSLSLAPGNKNYEGLCIVGDVVNKLNNLESTVNDLRNMILDFKSVYNAHTHEVASFGTPSTNLTPTYTDTAPSALTLTQKSDIENPQVVHGNGIPDNLSWYGQIQGTQALVTANQALVTIALGAITSFKLNNPGQAVPDALTSAYNQAVVNLQTQEQQLMDLQNNPPH